MKKYLLHLFFLFASVTGNAQSIVWDGTNEYIDIGKKVYLLEDSAGKFTIDEVSSPAWAPRFQKSTQQVIHHGASESFYWIKFSIENTSHDDLTLEVAQHFIPHTDLYFKDNNGKWKCYKAGYKINLTKKVIQSNFQIFPLEKKCSEFYVRYTVFNQSLPIKIWKNEAYQIKANHQKLLYGLYVGLLLFIILNNLFLFFSLRKWTYLHYSILVFGYLTISAMVLDGYLPYLFPGTDMLFWYRQIPILNMPIALLYCILFLEMKKYAPKSYRFGMGVFIYFIVYAVWSQFFPFKYIFNISSVHALVLFIVVATISINAGRKGNRLGYYFAVTYFIWFFFVVLQTLNTFTGNPPYYFEVSHVSVAIFIEVIILAFLLSKRFEWEKRDIEEAKAEAQYKLIAQTQENERIVKEQNIILEQKVEERTHQLKETNEQLNVTLERVEKEMHKSESLLHNILPEEVAQELKNSGKSDARLFNEVTVMFTDFVNFTSISEKLTPEELVYELDFCFQKFDEIITTHDLEKIKTIGDAYLSVCGLPLPHTHHAHLVVKAAKEICDFMKWYEKRKIKENRPYFEVRVGIHSGPVVAGIVGVKKFAYDIWGDTVNTASRMESSSEPGRINISGATYELVKHEIKCQHRGKIEAKNKGMIDMYFVE